MNTDAKIFLFVFLIVFFSAFLSLFMLIPFYYGHPLVDLGRLANWVSSLFIVFFLFSSFIIASASVIFYEMYKMAKRRREKKID
jgi:multisubunit Na+/H+ antiporter MnhB subunit